MDIFLFVPQTTLWLVAAVLIELIDNDKPHYFVRSATRMFDNSVPHLFISQHDVTFELATLFPRTLLGPDICNKTYGNSLSVATGCSSCNNYAAVLVEQFYTALVDFVGWSSVLSFTEAHAGFLN